MNEEKDYVEIIKNLTDGVDSERFRKIVNKLLSVNFIVKAKAKEKTDYEYIRRNKDLFTVVFMHLLGYNLVVDEQNGVAYIQDVYGSNKVEFGLDESIVILLLCLIYQEKSKDISLSDGIYTTAEEINERYNGLKHKFIRPTNLRTIIRKLKRYNLVFCDKDISRDALVPIQIFPSILFVLRREGLNEEYDSQLLLETYREETEDEQQPEDNR